MEGGWVTKTPTFCNVKVLGPLKEVPCLPTLKICSPVKPKWMMEIVDFCPSIPKVVGSITENPQLPSGAAT